MGSECDGEVADAAQGVHPTGCESNDAPMKEEAKGGKRKAGGGEDAKVPRLECGICAEVIKVQGVLGHWVGKARPGCGHIFCFTCIKRWSRQSNHCPTCRAEFTRLKRLTLKTGAVKEMQVRRATFEAPPSPEASEEGDGAPACYPQWGEEWRVCYVCGCCDNPAQLLACTEEGCENLQHTYCVVPPLRDSHPPEGFTCTACKAKRVEPSLETCPVCDMSFEGFSEEAITQHMDDHVNTAGPPPQPPGPPPGFAACPMCEGVFPEAEIQDHVERCLDPAPQPPPPPPPLSEPTTTTCPVCQKTLPEEHMQAHVETHFAQPPPRAPTVSHPRLYPEAPQSTAATPQAFRLSPPPAAPRDRGPPAPAPQPPRDSAPRPMCPVCGMTFKAGATEAQIAAHVDWHFREYGGGGGSGAPLAQPLPPAPRPPPAPAFQSDSCSVCKMVFPPGTSIGEMSRHINAHFDP
eukprot:TRINITY_DN4926_c1_g1_i1.p1 TRINITY_DN4926_c1_g1~~TRINITY_DN4926_c1_g1_i1.p1  ORF type:complete len:462 (+),score=72.59 TRINITY_DN4926_c1_g1_i1:81-1466(+)